MKPHVTAIERAFELANSGRFLYVPEIRTRLREEGYFVEGITGPQLIGQLKAAMQKTLKKQHKL